MPKSNFYLAGFFSLTFLLAACTQQPALTASPTKMDESILTETPFTPAADTPTATKTINPSPTSTKTYDAWKTFCEQSYQLSVDTGEGLFLYDLYTDKKVRLADSPLAFFTDEYPYWVWSPDGSQLVYQKQSQIEINGYKINLQILNLNNSEVKPIEERWFDLRQIALQWIPGQEAFAFDAELLQVETGYLISTLPGKNVIQQSFSSDGNHLVVLTWFYDLPIQDLISIYDFQFNSLGQVTGINFINSCAFLYTNELACSDHEPGKFTEADTQKLGYWQQIFNVKWSPANDQIAFLAERDPGEYNIYLVNSDGTGLKNLTQMPKAGEVLAGLQPSFEFDWYAFDWSPDGKQITFSAVCSDITSPSC